MRPNHEKRQLTTIVVADVVGYSRLMAGDEGGTYAQIKAHRKELIEPRLAEFRGRIVKLMGDGALMVFDSVVDAVLFAVAIQRAVAERNAEIPAERQVSYRIGINVGDIIVADDDIYGDGVNVAARLQEMAESGCVYISGHVLNQVEGKVNLAFEDFGQKQLKNIPHPIRVYRVLPVPAKADGSPGSTGRKRRLRARPVAALVAVVLIVGGAAVAWLQPWRSSEDRASVGRMAYPLPAKPSLAVLPFDNMTGKPEEDYFADGITDDLITDLSKISGLFVIARNSVFTYKHKPVKVQRVSEELGVRYVLEGSVRRSEGRIRINAQLTDATNGRHLWAERYDRDYKDIFTLQDEVTQRIVAALSLQLSEGERAQLKTRYTNDLKAHEYYLRGQQTLHSFSISYPEEINTALLMYEEAIR